MPCPSRPQPLLPGDGAGEMAEPLAWQVEASRPSLPPSSPAKRRPPANHSLWTKTKRGRNPFTRPPRGELGLFSHRRTILAACWRICARPVAPITNPTAESISRLGGPDHQVPAPTWCRAGSSLWRQQPQPRDGAGIHPREQATGTCACSVGAAKPYMCRRRAGRRKSPRPAWSGLRSAPATGRNNSLNNRPACCRVQTPPCSIQSEERPWPLPPQTRAAQALGETLPAGRYGRS